MSDCKSYVSKEDLQALKESQLHIENVARSRNAAGEKALQATDPIRGENVTNRTLDGLEKLYEDSISKIGWVLIESFQTGAELTLRNQALHDETTGEYYRWNGELPKSVPSGSTPQTTGGVGMDAWVSVGDGSLRSELSSDKGFSLIGGCDSIVQLRNITGENNGDKIILNSYYTGKNKGGGVFVWDAQSSAVDDGGCIIKPNSASTGRWIREYQDRYTPEMYGADGTKENDPDAIYRLITSQQRILLIGTYFYNRELVTNGHDITGAKPSEIWGSPSDAKIIFFGGFNSKQAVRNEKRRSVYRNISFLPESWDPSTGYTGTGLRLDRGILAELCNWYNFKEYGMDLWEDSQSSPILAPYNSMFLNCRWERNGLSGIRLAQGANNVNIYGGASGFNGSPSYGVNPKKGDPQVGDGILLGHFSDVPTPSYALSLQGTIVEGIDCSYNARYGLNAEYCNQSILNIGYSEWNLAERDIYIGDIVACDVNVLVATYNPSINVPAATGSQARSALQYPNKIRVNGVNYGTGIKDSSNRYLDYNFPKFGSTVFSIGSLTSSGLRSYSDNTGAVESFGVALFRANSGARPAASEKYLGTLWRDTSVYPNAVYMCIQNSATEYGWSKLN